MSAQDGITRARQLLDVGRPAEAKRELQQVLASDPGDAFALRLLTRAHLDLDESQEAVVAARSAVSAEPDHPIGLVLLSQAMLYNGHTKEARRYAQAALAIWPENASAFACLGAADLSEGRWKPALEHAEKGLEFDPEHDALLEFRAEALSRLGRHEEAMQATAHHLSMRPDDSSPNTAQGYVLLRQGDDKAALSHFGAALRDDPNCEAAREGALSALRARFWPYRILLQFHSFLGRYGRNSYWVALIAIYVMIRLLRSVAEQYPQVGFIAYPVIVVLAFIIYFGALGTPLLNATLMAHPMGRHVLTRYDRWESVLTLGFILVGAGALAARVWTGVEALTGVVIGCVLGLLMTALLPMFMGQRKKLLPLWLATLAAVAVAILFATAAGDEPQAR